MASSLRSTGNQRPIVRRLAGLAILVAIGLFVAKTAVKAIASPWHVDDFPDALYIKVEQLPWIFAAHMITGGLALFVVPAMIVLSRSPHWHRRFAWLAVPVVVVAGITAFPVAMIAPVTTVSAWGFATQGAVWLILLGLGIWHIRHQRLARHREMMLLMAATTTGAVFFRVYLALFAIFGHPRYYHAFYAADAWLAWTLPLAAMAFFLKRTGAKPGFPR